MERDGETGGARPRLLLVEDDAATRRALARLLASRGCRVLEAESVRRGLELLMAEPPDAVVLDLMLPDGSGAEVLGAVRAAGLPSRVVVTTGAADGGPECAAALRLKPDALLRKPIRFDELWRAIGRPD